MESTLGGTSKFFNDNFIKGAWLPVLAYHIYICICIFISIYWGDILTRFEYGGGGGGRGCVKQNP